MNQIAAWGLDWIRWVQHAASPTLTVAAKAVSSLGTEYFFLLALPFVYWCVDRRRGIRIGLLFFLSAFLNGWVKHVTAEPRPYEVDASVGLAHETTSSFPSFHAQSSAVFWGGTLGFFPRRWIRALVLLVPLLVGLSRVYLGVHYPGDVLAGWAIGLFFVLGEWLFGTRIAEAVLRQREQIQLAIVAVVALAMNAIDMRDTSVSGAFLGFGAGVVLAQRSAAFSVAGSRTQKLLRFVVGASGMIILYFGARALSSAVEPLDPALVRFVRYALLGFWASLGAPWFFLRLGLCGREERALTAPLDVSADDGE